MKILRSIAVGLAIVLGVTLAGALTPFIFRERMENNIATVSVCEFLGHTERIGLTSERRRDLIDAALASDIGEATKVIVARTRTDCR